MPTHSEGSPRLEPVVVSSTFREAPTAQREALAAILARVGGTLPEHVLLHTCHRVELVAVADDAWTAPARDDLRVLRGADAVERAILVAGGLDSAVIAEEQLQGQVRAAYRTALESGTTGPHLNELFRRAIRFGRKARSLAQPGGDRSLAERAVRLAHDRLDPARREGSALVVGTGAMGRVLAAELAERGMSVTVASRTPDAAARLCAELPALERCRATNVTQALDRLGEFDLVALAARSPQPILDRRQLEAAPRRPLVVDLSAPPMVTSEAADWLGAGLLDLDRLGGSDRPALDDAALRRLRTLARRERDAYLGWMQTRANGDALELLARHATEVRQRHVERLRRAGRFDAAQLAAVDGAAAAMLGEILHDPIVRARHDPSAAAAIRRLFGSDA